VKEKGAKNCRETLGFCVEKKRRCTQLGSEARQRDSLGLGNKFCEQLLNMLDIFDSYVWGIFNLLIETKSHRRRYITINVSPPSSQFDMAIGRKINYFDLFASLVLRIKANASSPMVATFIEAVPVVSGDP